MLMKATLFLFISGLADRGTINDLEGRPERIREKDSNSFARKARPLAAASKCSQRTKEVKGREEKKRGTGIGYRFRIRVRYIRPDLSSRVL